MSSETDPQSEQAVATSGRPVLEGLRVVDLSVAHAGPTAVRQLAEWGASVIRVEMPIDEPGMVKDHNSSDYMNLHGNKRLITLDLKSDEGRDILMRLLEDADILVENFRTPVKRHLGVSYEDLSDRFPTLIYGSISGFGQDGPSSARGAVDQIIQGTAGLMSVTGIPGGGPVRAGIAVADVAAGVLLANGLLLALLERQHSGRGQWVQVSLLEALISFMDFQAMRWIADHQEPGQAGNHHPSMSPMGTVEAADGYLNIGASSDRLWRRLCTAIGAPELAERSEYATGVLRQENKEQLYDDLRLVFKKRPKSEWIEVLNEAGVPCGPVNLLSEVFDDPQVRHLKMAVPIDHPSRGSTSVLRNPISMSRMSRAEKTPSPTASQHTEEILAELGYSTDEISDLRSRGIV